MNDENLSIRILSTGMQRALQLVLDAPDGYTLLVTDDAEIRKINAIVGAAIKALAESGADDEFIGSFAASHRAKVSRLLGTESDVDATPDLLTLVTQAVGKALEAAGMAKDKGGRRTGTVRATRRVNVVIQGRRTSLTLGRTVFEQLVQSKGTNSDARAVIQELANSSPQMVDNRSAWVEERILAIMATREEQGDSMHRH